MCIRVARFSSCRSVPKSGKFWRPVNCFENQGWQHWMGGCDHVNSESLFGGCSAKQITIQLAHTVYKSLLIPCLFNQTLLLLVERHKGMDFICQESTSSDVGQGSLDPILVNGHKGHMDHLLQGGGVHHNVMPTPEMYTPSFYHEKCIQSVHLQWRSIVVSGFYLKIECNS